MTTPSHAERMRELLEEIRRVETHGSAVLKLADYADELHAEASYQRMTRDVFEEKLNEYIDKVREADAELRQAHDSIDGEHALNERLIRENQSLKDELTSEREARRRAEALLDDVKQAASESAADTYYRRDQCDAGEHWQIALEDIVARIDKAKEAPSGETKECPTCGGAAPHASDRCCRTCKRTCSPEQKEPTCDKPST